MAPIKRWTDTDILDALHHDGHTVERLDRGRARVDGVMLTPDASGRVFGAAPDLHTAVSYAKTRIRRHLGEE